MNSELLDTLYMHIEINVINVLYTFKIYENKNHLIIFIQFLYYLT